MSSSRARGLMEKPFLVHKILTFYINCELNCKCPAPGSEGYGKTLFAS